MSTANSSSSSEQNRTRELTTYERELIERQRARARRVEQTSFFQKLKKQIGEKLIELAIPATALLTDAASNMGGNVGVAKNEMITDSLRMGSASRNEQVLPQTVVTSGNVIKNINILTTKQGEKDDEGDPPDTEYTAMMPSFGGDVGADSPPKLQK